MAYDLVNLSRWISSELDKRPRTSLAILAREAAVDRHTIHKAIRLTGKKSFRRLQSDILRIKAIELMTGSSNLSIKEISYLLGYRSSRAFSRFIRQGYDKSPSELRQSMRDKAGIRRTATLLQENYHQNDLLDIAEC
jgi:AraC-like DNA-binding protein